MDELTLAQARPPMPRNYYAVGPQDTDTLRYRLGAHDDIDSFCDQLRGIQRDARGKETNTKDEQDRYRVVNDEGIYQIRAFLRASCSKITHLTKYTNEDRVLRQMRELSKAWLFMIILHRKTWEIRDRDIVLHPGEKLLFESMLRANDGFENNNISKAYNVNENIDRMGAPPPMDAGARPGLLRRFFQ